MWVSVKDVLPPENTVVDTKIQDSDGNTKNHQKLMLKGRLWFVPDCSMYVYYQPTHWSYDF